MLQKIISHSNLGVRGLMNPVNQQWFGGSLVHMKEPLKDACRLLTTI